VLLSPGLDYRGLRTEAAIKKFGGRAALLVSSTKDPYAWRSVKTLRSCAIAQGCLRRDGNGERPPAIMRGRGRSLAPTPKRSTADATDAPKPCAGPNRAFVEVPGVTSSACFFSLAPPLRGRDEQSSLLEGRGEGHLSANSDASGQTCTPSPDASRRPLPASGAR